MTAAEFRAAIAAAGMSQLGFARWSGFAPRTVRRWCLDESPVPEFVARIAAAIERDPSLVRRIYDLNPSARAAAKSDPKSAGE